MTIHVFSSALPPPRYVGCQTEKMRSKSACEFLQTESAAGAKVPTFRYRMRRRSARLRPTICHQDQRPPSRQRRRDQLHETPVAQLVQDHAAGQLDEKVRQVALGLIAA
jgi:hypothetical protein